MDEPRRVAETLVSVPAGEEAAAAALPPEAPAPVPQAAPVPPPKPSRRRWVIAAAVPLVLVVSAVAARGPLLGMLVQNRASALGIALDFDDLERTSVGVKLTGVRISLSGVRGVRVTATTLRVATSWLSVASVDADGVAVTVEGPLGDRVLDLASWSGEHPGVYGLRGSAGGVRVEWRARPDTPAWLTMSEGVLAADGKSARFVAATSAFGVPLGSVGASFVVQSAGVTLEAGKNGGGEAPLVAVLRTATRPPELGVTLRKVELSALGSALGVSLSARGAVVSAHADLTLGRSPAGVSGTGSLELDGWVPPHPKLLDAVVFGNKTTLRTKIHVSEDRAAVKLDDLEVRAGKLDMKGSGTVTEQGKSAAVRLELKGPIPCSDLARSAAKEELGGVLGGLAGEVAGRAVGGSAVVTVVVEADARDLGAARVTPKVGVGCELKLPGL
jgi:ADP-dependent NAD(P)H-hydrate dehydratase / NAD(P)H-hydrate epimerase